MSLCVVALFTIFLFINRCATSDHPTQATSDAPTQHLELEDDVLGALHRQAHKWRLDFLQETEEKNRKMVAQVRRLQEERKKRRSVPSKIDAADFGFYFEDLFPEGYDECDGECCCGISEAEEGIKKSKSSPSSQSNRAGDARPLERASARDPSKRYERARKWRRQQRQKSKASTSHPEQRSFRFGNTRNSSTQVRTQRPESQRPHRQPHSKRQRHE